MVHWQDGRRGQCYNDAMVSITNWLGFFKGNFKVIKKVNRPEYFSGGAGIRSMCSIARGQRLRAIEHTELLPAPREKCPGLLTAQALNNCILWLYQELFFDGNRIYTKPCHAFIRMVTFSFSSNVIELFLAFVMCKRLINEK